VAREIVTKALQSPLKRILSNAGVEDWWNWVPKGDTIYDAKQHKMVNAFDSGLLDPAKVVITAIKNAASVAGTLLTTESVIFEKAEKDEKSANPMGMPGMM
jgi:chaperonin GroEL